MNNFPKYQTFSKKLAFMCIDAHAKRVFSRHTARVLKIIPEGLKGHKGQKGQKGGR